MKIARLIYYKFFHILLAVTTLHFNILAYILEPSYARTDWCNASSAACLSHLLYSQFFLLLVSYSNFPLSGAMCLLFQKHFIPHSPLWSGVIVFILAWTYSLLRVLPLFVWSNFTISFTLCNFTCSFLHSSIVPCVLTSTLVIWFNFLHGQGAWHLGTLCWRDIVMLQRVFISSEPKTDRQVC